MRLPVSETIGWDLGGVHVKAALVEDGRVAAAVTGARAPSGRALPALDQALAALPDWARGEAAHAVTMTGELTDCFADRRAGVAGARQAGPRSQSRRDPCGSMPAAPASSPPAAARGSRRRRGLGQLARHRGARPADSPRSALLVDIGSTTADLIPIVGGLPATTGYSDAERLETGELVYTGIGAHAGDRALRSRPLRRAAAPG